MSGTPSNEEVAGLLLALRENPQTACPSATMIKLSNYLMRNTVEIATPEGFHWFCDTPQTLLPTDSTVIDLDPLEPPTQLCEVASYCLTYHAYNTSVPVKRWKNSLANLLGRCTACVEGYEKAKLVIEERYLSNHSASVLQNFFGTIADWEASQIAVAGSRVQVEPLEPNLSRLPPSLVHLLLLSPALAQTPQMQAMFLRASTSTLALSASDVGSHLDGRYPAVGEGLLELLLDPPHPPPIEVEEAPPENPPQPPHLSVRNLARLLLPPVKSITLSRLPKTLPTIERLLAIIARTSSVQVSASEAWEMLVLVLQRLDDEALRVGIVGGLEGKGKGVLERPDRWLDSVCGGRTRWTRTAGIVCSHLGENINYFPHIFSSFLLLLNAAGRALWIQSSPTSPTPPNPIVALDTIKENQQFLALFEKGDPRAFEWFDTYVRSLVPAVGEVTTRSDGSEDDSYQEGLKKTINFLAEGVQHSRFDLVIGVKAMTEVFRILSRAARSTATEPTRSPRRRAVQAVYEIYSSTISSVAFGAKDHKDPEWIKLRPPAKKILSLAFDDDASTIRKGVLMLAKALREKNIEAAVVLPSFDVRTSLWKSAYDGMGVKRAEIEGLGLVIRAVARYAHVEILDHTQGAWETSRIEPTLRRRGVRGGVEQLNQSLVTTRTQFASAVERFANINPADTLLKLWAVPLVPAAAMSLLLSPVEDIHEATQALVQQTFPDVEDRADCFRALLANMPDQSMQGLIDFLSTFVETATVYPEACSMAKFMVRCLTDVIDVLCKAPRGLLLDDVFVNHEGIRRLVPKLWRMMTESISVVFNLTGRWANFYPNDVMVDWMRDALIFARLMVDMTRTFETAAVGGASTTSYYSIFSSQSGSGPPPSPAKMSTVGKGMVESLNGVLRDLLGWLRITEVETLHQAFELVKLILDRFHRSKMEPSRSSITKLQAFVDRAKGSRCKLTDGQLAEISDMLAWWDDDEIVEIIQPKVKPPSSASRPDASSKERQKAAWASVMSSSPASSKSTKSTSKPSTSRKSWRGPAPVEKDEFDDEFDAISDSDLPDVVDLATAARKPANGSTSSRTAPPKSGVVQLQSKGFSLTNWKAPSSSVPKMGTIAGLRTGSTTKPVAPSTSSRKSGGLGQLRQDFKHERRELPKTKVGALAQPSGGMKAGFGGFKLSSTNKSEIEPSKVKRRTDTQGSDSSNTDSSDEEEESRGLALFSQSAHKKSSAPVRTVAPPTRTIKLMPDAVAIKSPADLRRAAKELAHRTRLRLKPDLESLHRTILQWDPKDTNSLPPNFSADSLQKIPDQFRDADQYLRILQPLLMLECWAQVQKAVEDTRNEPRVPCELAGRINVDDWIDIEFSIALNELRGNYYLNDVDVVQISPGEAGTGGSTLFAKVTKYKRGFKDVLVTLRFHNSRDLRPFQSRTKWILQKVVNLSTMHREYGGLQGMPYFDHMLPAILQSSSSPLVEPSGRSLDDAMHAYQVNRPQAKAILGAMSPNASGFVLIQGPPGTGKTKTICGLVGKFLSDRAEPATKIRQGGGPPKPEDTQPTLKILVCAPSNAAIDEVTKRLRDGIRSSTGKIVHPKIVRIGNDSSINVAVKDVSLDELVDQRLRGTSALASGDGAAEMARIRQEVDAVQASNLVVEKKLQDAYAAGGDATSTAGLEEEIKKLKTRRARLMQELNKAKDAQKDSSRSLDAARRKARQDVVLEADIICSTLSGAGHDLLGSFNFETVIIDEAAQAVELSALIPLKYQCRRCIMVGDPNQLPPTVMSQAAEKYNYSESMFVRIQRKSPHNVHLLSIQYRMHPDISVLPSRVFYDGNLADGPDMATKTAQPWHASNAFAPYRFINVNSSREMTGHGHSLKNQVEADVALLLYKSLKDQYPAVDFDFRVGIVTMYKEQKFELIRRFSSLYGQGIVSRIDFNTVDGFQGQEKDIIILSCVRAGAPGSNAGVGFLKDSRRMNVALTRARSSLFIIGHAPTLEGGGPQWKGIVHDARSRSAMVDYHPNVFQPTRGALPAAPTGPKSDRAPPPPPPGPSVPPPPLPPSDLQTPKEMIAARKLAKKEDKDGRKRAPSPPSTASLPFADEARPAKKAKTDETRPSSSSSGKDWVAKMKADESDSGSDSDSDVEMGPPRSSSSSVSAKPKTVVPLNDPRSSLTSTSTSAKRGEHTNGSSTHSSSSSSSSKAPSKPSPPPTKAPAPPPPPSAPPPAPAPRPPPATSKAPIRARPKASLFMPAKKKIKPMDGVSNPFGPGSGSGPSSGVSGGGGGQSARAAIAAQALKGMPPPPRR